MKSQECEPYRHTETLCLCGQVFEASIPALTLENADISSPSSVPVRLSVKSGPVQAASVQKAMAVASADSSAHSAAAMLAAPASSRRLQIWEVLSFLSHCLIANSWTQSLCSKTSSASERLLHKEHPSHCLGATG